MMSKAEIQEWLNGLNPNSSVGIDEGGLTLVEIGPEGKSTGVYLEIGGIPSEDAEA